MPHRLNASYVVGGILTLAAAALVGLLLVALVPSPSASDPAGETLGVRAPGPVDIAAGDVDVRIEPIRVDEAGAVFLVSLDTHSIDLDIDIAGSATLDVDGVAWGGVSWVGDPPGGHHRSGELSFEFAGPTDGRITLRIDGLPGPVVVEWDLGA